MLLDPLPPINCVFSLVLQQEQELRLPSVSHILMAKAPIVDPSATSRPSPASAHTSSKSSTANNNNKVCTYCGRPRHTKAACYRKHGFAPGFKFRSSSSSSTVNCVASQDTGSVQSYVSVVHSSIAPTSTTASLLAQLSSNQYQRLLAFLNTPTTPVPSVNNLSTSSITATAPLTPAFHDNWCI